jgi:hypothetical protein
VYDPTWILGYRWQWNVNGPQSGGNYYCITGNADVGTQYSYGLTGIGSGDCQCSAVFAGDGCLAIDLPLPPDFVSWYGAGHASFACNTLEAGNIYFDGDFCYCPPQSLNPTPGTPVCDADADNPWDWDP